MVIEMSRPQEFRKLLSVFRESWGWDKPFHILYDLKPWFSENVPEDNVAWHYFTCGHTYQMINMMADRLASENSMYQATDGGHKFSGVWTFRSREEKHKISRVATQLAHLCKGIDVLAETATALERLVPSIVLMELGRSPISPQVRQSYYSEFWARRYSR